MASGPALTFVAPFVGLLCRAMPEPVRLATKVATKVEANPAPPP
jgi:hypothetical protein